MCRSITNLLGYSTTRRELGAEPSGVCGSKSPPCHSITKCASDVEASGEDTVRISVDLGEWAVSADHQ